MRNFQCLVCPYFFFLRIWMQAYGKRWVFWGIHTRFTFLPYAGNSHGEAENDILTPKMALKMFSLVVCNARMRPQELHVCNLTVDVLTLLNST